MRRALALALLSGCGGASASRTELVPGFDAGASWVVDVNGSADGRALWAVGGTDGEGRIWDGARGFDPLALPPELGSVPLLHWVHALDDGSLITVGKGGTILRRVQGTWQRDDAGTEQDLWGVWGPSGDDLWAVGGDGQAEGHATLLHFDGSAWAPYALPELARPRVWAFYKVWGSASDDVYVVGQSGVALHFDGAGFEELGLGTSQDLVSVYGSGARDVWIVGGRDNGVAAHFDGARWTSRSLAPLPGLNGVWTDGGGEAYAVGVEGSVARLDARLSAERIPLATPSRLTLHAVFGAAGTLYAVGGNLAASVPPYASLTLTLDLENAP